MRPTTLAELDQARLRCQKLVSRRALVSAAAAVVPIPGVDVSTDVAILLQLIPAINEEFGLSPSQINALSPELQKIVIVGGANFGVGLLGKIITPQLVIQVLQRIGVKKLAGKYATKYIPVVGSVIASTVSYAVLRKVGNQHINECYAMAKQLIEVDDTALTTT
ncbi:hypothetical protein PAEH1_03400 [Paenalcaligenes hominis]|uniref:DUF697 domain-containing protein n=1 Tax=Paenalcaligenes hominis TaxID=643674 RepID=A0A1U9JYJ3_9BURK|nr:hypothetical protein [Paenalcaligenes hominis]AQS50847.1 hypothetical protein PAEH1_03400 [Paenalcaligenes hominis]